MIATLSSIKKLKKKNTVGCQPFLNWPEYRQKEKLEKKKKRKKM
jgi:hypothetical protein